MKFTATCARLISDTEIVKVLLTVSSHPTSQDEHLLCNLLRSRGDLEVGKTYLVTIEETRRES